VLRLVRCVHNSICGLDVSLCRDRQGFSLDLSDGVWGARFICVWL
jgi:hypothetical protein